MEYKNVGKSGLRVSVVGLGGNNFGRQRVAGAGVDAESASAVIGRAIDEGITFF